MATEMGEYLVGAYLKFIERCDFVDYNVRDPDGGIVGLKELDVVGINLKTSTAYLCEVATHVRGVLYQNNDESVRRVRAKYEYQQEYAERHLGGFEHHRYMFWSPVVPRGILTKRLPEIAGLELVINGDHKKKVKALLEMTAHEKQGTQNPVFRVFQILESMRED